jgi:hypothetical protein
VRHHDYRSAERSASDVTVKAVAVVVAVVFVGKIMEDVTIFSFRRWRTSLCGKRRIDREGRYGENYMTVWE